MPNKKSTGTVYLLLMFLWPFAAHRFYLRHVGMGFFMIISIWISALYNEAAPVDLLLLPAGLAGLVITTDVFRLPSLVRRHNRIFDNESSVDLGPGLRTKAAIRGESRGR